MENTFFLRIEIILFIISFLYIIYYCIHSFQRFFRKKGRNGVNKKTREEQLVDSTQIHVDEKNDNYKKESGHKNIMSEDKIKITEILRKEAIYYERRDYEKAKSLIVEGLALDKFHKQLNLELANIYNKEADYKKSEYIYRELIENQKEDFELLKKLGFVLALQKKYKDSIRVYKEAYERRKNDPGIIDILSDLTYEVEDYEGTVKFATKFLIEKPRDVEKLQLQAYSYDKLGNTKKALLAYNKILEMKPYEEEIVARINVLESENKEKDTSKVDS